jgi:hypothetical protein
MSNYGYNDDNGDEYDDDDGDDDDHQYNNGGMGFGSADGPDDELMQQISRLPPAQARAMITAILQAQSHAWNIINGG